jgi:hypothetical protein
MERMKGWGRFWIFGLGFSKRCKQNLGWLKSLVYDQYKIQVK